MSQQAEPRAGFRVRFRDTLANRKLWIGLICALPSLVGFVSAQLVDAALDRSLVPLLSRQRDLAKHTADLDRLTRTYEAEELLRVSFRLAVFANGGNDDFAFKLDQVHRASGLNFLRHLVVLLDKPALDARIEDYGTTVIGDYRQNGGATRLQEAENAIITEAKSRLSADQAELGPLEGRTRDLEAEKRRYHDALTYLGWIASILAFFVKLDG